MAIDSPNPIRRQKQDTFWRRVKQRFNRGCAYEGTIVAFVPSGALLRLDNSAIGLVREREFDWVRRHQPGRDLALGRVLKVTVTGYDDGRHRLELSFKDTTSQTSVASWVAQGRLTPIRGIVSGYSPAMNGAFVELENGFSGYLPKDEIPVLGQRDGQPLDELLHIGDRVRALVTGLEGAGKECGLSIKRMRRLSGLNSNHARRGSATDDAPGRPGFYGASEDDDEGSSADSVVLAIPKAVNIRKVLVVDNDEDLARDLAAILAVAGHECLVVTTLEECLAKIRSSNVDVIVADLEMPEAPATDLIRQLQLENRCPKFIVVSAFVERRRLLELDRCGDILLDFLPKPVSLSALCRMIDTLIGGQTQLRRELDHLQREEDGTERDKEFIDDPVLNRLRKILNRFRSRLPFDAAVLFKEAASGLFETWIALGEVLTAFDQRRERLKHSPIRNVIEKGEVVCEARALSPNREKFMGDLRVVAPYESILGYPVDLGNGRRAGLFLFTKSPDAYSDREVQTAGDEARALLAALKKDHADQKKATEQTLATIGKSLACLAHELNHLLSLVQMRLVLLQNDLKKATESDQPRTLIGQGYDNVRWVARNFRSLQELVGSLLRIGGAGGSPPRSVRSILDDVVALATAVAGFRGKVSVLPALDMNLLEVEAPVLVIAQPAMNILLNAIAHTEQVVDPPHEVRIVARKDGDDVKITVTDTGHGIHEAHKQEIFREFFSTRPGGTGIGLHLARQLVEDAGGSLELTDTSLLLGSTFEMTVPMWRK